MRIEIPVSLSEVEVKTGFKLLPPGTYNFEITNIEMKTSKAGFPKMAVAYSVLDDPEYAGTKVFEDISLAPQALYSLKKLAMATGVEIDKVFDTEDFLGAHFTAVVEVEEGDEIPGQPGEKYKDRNKIKSYIFKTK